MPPARHPARASLIVSRVSAQGSGYPSGSLAAALRSLLCDTLLRLICAEEVGVTERVDDILVIIEEFIEHAVGATAFAMISPAGVDLYIPVGRISFSVPSGS